MLYNIVSRTLYMTYHFIDNINKVTILQA